MARLTAAALLTMFLGTTTLSAAAQPTASDSTEADAADALVRGSYQAVLDGPAFRFDVRLQVDADDTTFVQSGTAVTHAAPPDGVLWHRIDYADGEVTAEAFDGSLFMAQYPRTRKVYVDSTAAALDEGAGVFLRLHPALGMSLYNLYARADEVRLLGADAVNGRPCQAVFLYLDAETPLSTTACFDDETRLPSRVVVETGADARFETTFGVAERIPTPDPERFRLSLPEGYAFAPYDGSRQPRLAVGEQAPDFEVTSLEGGTIRLSDYRGRVVLLDFWGTWCAPCAESIPRLGALADGLPDLVVLGLAAYEDDTADPLAFARSRGASYPIAHVPESTVEDYLVRAFPTYYIIGPDGTILFEGVPDEDETVDDRLAAFARSILALR